MSKFVPMDMEWFLADIIQQFTFANGDDPLIWVNTHLVQATSPNEAYTKSMALGEPYNHTFTNTDQVEVTSIFRGLKNLLLIYEKLEHGAEIMWTEYDDLSEEQVTAMITPRESLGVFVTHSDDSRITSAFEAEEDEQGRESVHALNLEAQTRRDSQDYPGSVALYEQSIRTLRKLHRPSELAYTLCHAAELHSQLGQLQKARGEIAEAIRVYRNASYTSSIDLANSLRLSALNDERMAVAAWKEARTLYTSLGIQPGVDEACRHVATGDPQ